MEDRFTKSIPAIEKLVHVHQRLKEREANSAYSSRLAEELANLMLFLCTGESRTKEHKLMERGKAFGAEMKEHFLHSKVNYVNV